MASPAGVTNGTKVIIGIETTLDSATYTPLEGEATHSIAFNRALIEITNKSSDQFREYLSGDEGTKALDVTIESLRSDDAMYARLRAAWFDGTILRIRRTLGALVLDGDMLVENMSDSANLNEAVKSTFALKSTGEFTEA